MDASERIGSVFVAIYQRRCVRTRERTVGTNNILANFISKQLRKDLLEYEISFNKNLWYNQSSSVNILVWSDRRANPDLKYLTSIYNHQSSNWITIDSLFSNQLVNRHTDGSISSENHVLSTIDEYLFNFSQYHFDSEHNHMNAVV
jgi:hypothetical protein